MLKQLLFFLFLLPISLLAQAYIPFPNSMIIYGGHDRRTSSGDDFTQVRTEMYGDTIVGSFTYKKVYNGLGPLSLEFGIRQDIPGKKVYQYDFSAGTERLLYDFNLNVGDTVFSSSGYGFYYGMDGGHPDGSATAYIVDTAWVTRIDSVLMPHDGLYHKRFNFSATVMDPGFSGYTVLVSSDSVGPYDLPALPLYYKLEPLIEGVGQLYGPVQQAFQFEGYFKRDVFCASINGNPVISNFYTGMGPWGVLDPTECNSLTTVVEIGPENKSFDIYPNPSTTGKFQMKIENAKSIRLEITDVLGKIILTSEIKNVSQEIDLSDQQKGTYFVRAIDDKGNLFVKKIVIEKIN